MLEFLFLADGEGNAIGDKITEILQNAFGVNLTDFIINLSATILLLLIVRFFFWNKVTNFLDAKKEKIKEEYKDAASIKAEAEEIKKEADQTLIDSKTEANKIMVDAKHRRVGVALDIVETLNVRVIDRLLGIYPAHKVARTLIARRRAKS